MIKNKLMGLADNYPRYGFKKLFWLLRQQGHPWNRKRVYRLYRTCGLNLKKKPKKRIAPRTALTLIQPQKLNECWSLDFMSDALRNGQRFRTANVIIDDANREGLSIQVALSLPALHMVRWLDNVAAWRRYPKQIRVDNGPGNLAFIFRQWAQQHGIELLYIQPGKPAQNAFIERFNRSYREEVLDMYLFDSIAQVQQLTDQWLLHYNGQRPHEALGNRTPLQAASNL
jgi:putative transposase